MDDQRTGKEIVRDALEHVITNTKAGGVRDLALSLYGDDEKTFDLLMLMTHLCVISPEILMQLNHQFLRLTGLAEQLGINIDQDGSN